jgi:hypothetical protein
MACRAGYRISVGTIKDKPQQLPPRDRSLHAGAGKKPPLDAQKKVSADHNTSTPIYPAQNAEVGSPFASYA